VKIWRWLIGYDRIKAQGVKEYQDRLAKEKEADARNKFWEENYQKAVHCNNCDQLGYLVVPTGTRLTMAICKTCKCKSARPISETERLAYLASRRF
jgi:hypothetical protein